MINRFSFSHLRPKTEVFVSESTACRPLAHPPENQPWSQDTHTPDETKPSRPQKNKEESQNVEHNNGANEAGKREREITRNSRHEEGGGKDTWQASATRFW